MSRLDEIESFVAIVEAGSLSGASRRSGLALSAVSRRLKDLEARMGVTLLQRSTRSLSLTAAGEEFHLRCRQILADLEEAEANLRDQTGAVTGRIRIAAPVSFTALHLGPLLAEFASNHPELTLDLDLNDRRVDLVEEGFDLAIRIGRLEDSSLIARRLTPIRHVPTVSPQLLKTIGHPSTPEELAQFPALRYRSARLRDKWRFRRPDGSEGSVTVEARMLCNNGDVLVAAAKRGLGLCLEPTFVTAPAVQDGHLIPLFSDHKWSDNAAYVVFPNGRSLPRRVRLLVDYLIHHLTDDPWWDAVVMNAAKS